MRSKFYFTYEMVYIYFDNVYDYNMSQFLNIFENEKQPT